MIYQFPLFTFTHNGMIFNVIQKFYTDHKKNLIKE